MSGSPLEESVLPKGEPVLAAVSGGMDSVVLAHALAASGRRFQIAHVHHGLRASADEDLTHVRRLAESLSTPFHALRVSVDASSASLQEAAREARYAALADCARKAGLRYIATAHHLQDQVETVLLNLARGTGPEGLAGMAASRALPGFPDLLLVRPFLAQTRARLSAYARTHDLSWVEDPTNQDLTHRRNAVRSRLLPVLEDIFGPSVLSSIARGSDLMRAYLDSDLVPMTEVLLETLTRPLPQTHLKAQGCQLELAGLAGQSEVWRRRVLLEALENARIGGSRDAQTAERLDALLQAQPGRRQEFEDGTVWRERDTLSFVRVMEAPDPDSSLEFERGKGTRYGELAFHAQSASYWFEPTQWGAAVPTQGPYRVRAWKDGDRIAIRNGSAKVKDVLTEAAVPAFARSTFPVVEADGQVLWIPGVRALWIADSEKSGSTWVRLSALHH